MTTVELNNQLSLPLLIKKYSLDQLLEEVISRKQQYHCHSISLVSTLSKTDFDACFSSVSSTSSADYANSSQGWQPGKKRREMKLPDLRYILVKSSVGRTSARDTRTLLEENSIEKANLEQETSGEVPLEDEALEQELVAWLSYMLTFEDGLEVIYCYELHVLEAYRRRGLGKSLLSCMEEIGRRVGVVKAMLTMFLANEKAARFYTNVGYVVDDFSPKVRTLRNTIVKPDYQILSKDLSKSIR